MPRPELTPNALQVLEARYLRTDAGGQVLETPDLANEYATEAAVQAYLAQIKNDVVEHADDLRRGKSEPDGGLLEAMIARAGGDSDALGRYRVNLLVDHSGATGAGVVYEDRPTFQNLVGRIEHVAQMGTLVTHFTLIKSGALHRANGGYLILRRAPIAARTVRLGGPQASPSGSGAPHRVARRGAQPGQHGLPRSRADPRSTSRSC